MPRPFLVWTISRCGILTPGTQHSEIDTLHSTHSALETLRSQLCTLNSTFSTLQPHHCTLNSQLCALNTAFATLHSTLRPQLCSLEMGDKLSRFIADNFDLPRLIFPRIRKRQKINQEKSFISRILDDNDLSFRNFSSPLLFIYKGELGQFRHAKTPQC